MRWVNEIVIVTTYISNFDTRPRVTTTQLWKANMPQRCYI